MRKGSRRGKYLYLIRLPGSPESPELHNLLKGGVNTLRESNKTLLEYCARTKRNEKAA